MKKFLGDDFLLESKVAESLYFDFAADLPIIDYHNHLSPQDIASNRYFESITAAWLEGDHYKWRAMRAIGVDEKYITGKASDRDKFVAWASTVPKTLRNPLYHWTHLELQRYFGISELLNEDTANHVFDQTTEHLATHGANDLLKDVKVELLCTTDDPSDNLEYHQKIRDKNSSVKVRPTFRPDKIFAIDTPAYGMYLKKIGRIADVNINSLDDLLRVAKGRVDFFHDHGCRLSDHGLERLYPVAISFKKSQAILKDFLSGAIPSQGEVAIFKMTILHELCKMYHEKGWAQQFHLGAIRDNNLGMIKKLGPDTGYDSIGDFQQVKGLSMFLNELDKIDQLSKTIVYNLNPADNEAFATMMGNFGESGIPGKMQFGSGWWFLDQKDGMEKQINTLSNMGLLSRFVGMLTDSRSFLSFPRHEYFRRILCNLLGNDVIKGEVPNDMDLLGSMVKDICYYNAKNYFQFSE